MNRTTYAVDIAKNAMQLHWVDAETGEIGHKKLTRAKLAEYFVQAQGGAPRDGGLRQRAPLGADVPGDGSRGGVRNPATLRHWHVQRIGTSTVNR